jgi:hypothetical protein
MQALTPFLIRIVSAWVAAVLSHVLRWSGVDYTPDELSKTAAEVAVFMIEWVLPVVASIAAVVKVALDKRFNKGNASAAPLITTANAEADYFDARSAAVSAKRRV